MPARVSARTDSKRTGPLSASSASAQTAPIVTPQPPSLLAEPSRSAASGDPRHSPVSAADHASSLPGLFFHPGLQQPQHHVHFLGSILPKQRSYSELVADSSNKICPVAKNDRSIEQAQCRRGLMPFRCHANMIRHFLSDHPDIAKETLPHSCLVCNTDCGTQEALAAHAKSATHLAELDRKSRKRTAAEAVSCLFLCASHLCHSARFGVHRGDR